MSGSGYKAGYKAYLAEEGGREEEKRFDADGDMGWSEASCRLRGAALERWRQSWQEGWDAAREGK